MSETPQGGYTPPPPTHPHYGYLTPEELAAQEAEEARLARVQSEEGQSEQGQSEPGQSGPGQSEQVASEPEREVPQPEQVRGVWVPSAPEVSVGSAEARQPREQTPQPGPPKEQFPQPQWQPQQGQFPQPQQPNPAHWPTEAEQSEHPLLPSIDQPQGDAPVTEAAVGAGTAYQEPPPVEGQPQFRPQAHDLMETRSRRDLHNLRATRGWRAAIANMTGGAIAPGPSPVERRELAVVERIVRPIEGRRTIMVINTKGGGGKTLVTLMLAAYLGRYRVGSTLAWDNNETEGTLGMRAPYRPHNRTVVDLLNDLSRLRDNPNAGPGELARWVREQGAMKFDVLASADDDESMWIVGGSEFKALHEQLSRFYRVMVVDTGNNRLSPNWLAAVEEADELVFATSLKDDVAVVAAKNLDAIVASGKGDLVRNSVCVISHTLERSPDAAAFQHTRDHFRQWVRAVVDVPYDPALGPGLQLDPTRVAPGTHKAWLDVTASVVDGL